MTVATTVTPIKWKESYFRHPFIQLEAISPVRYNISVKEIEADGTVTILPSLVGTIDDMLIILEGCFVEGSNFCEALKEYAGRKFELTKICFNFNDVLGFIVAGETAMEAKLRWDETAIRSGFGQVARQLKQYEYDVLSKDSELKELIENYRRQA